MRKLPIRLRQLADPQGKPLFWESSGQALLIILLVMAVALTISLSVISRSITDIRISQQTEEAARAYSAAEAGIEEALITGSSGSLTFSETGAKYTTDVAGVGEGNEFVFPQELTQNEIQTLYLARYETSGSLTRYYTAGTINVCWRGNAALEVSTYYQQAGSYKVARVALDPDASRRDTNKFDPPDGDSCVGLSNKKTLTLPTGANITLLFLRLRVFYANAQVGIASPEGPGGTLPSQGTKIESTGQAGQATRKVEVVRFHPAPPEIFDFVLFSETGLTK